MRGLGDQTSVRRNEKGPDDAGPSNQGGNPRYRLDGISLVTDPLPLRIGFIVGRLLSVSRCMVVDAKSALCGQPHTRLTFRYRCC